MPGFRFAGDQLLRRFPDRKFFRGKAEVTPKGMISDEIGSDDLERRRLQRDAALLARPNPIGILNYVLNAGPTAAGTLEAAQMRGDY